MLRLYVTDYGLCVVEENVIVIASRVRTITIRIDESPTKTPSLSMSHTDCNNNTSSALPGATTATKTTMTTTTWWTVTAYYSVARVRNRQSWWEEEKKKKKKKKKVLRQSDVIHAIMTTAVGKPREPETERYFIVGCVYLSARANKNNPVHSERSEWWR